MSCFLRQQDSVVNFLPRIALMLRILFVLIRIIRIIRKICGYFILFCHPDKGET
jgi:hypothetical protein